MTTRAGFLSGVRAELQDPGPANYVWTDGLLQTFLNEMLYQLSVDLPPVREVTLAAVVGQRDYVIPAGTLALGPGGIREVQFPAGFVVPEGSTGAQYLGAAGLVSSNFQVYDQRWELLAGAGDSNTLRFRYGLAQSGSIVVRACGIYTQPGSDGAILDVNAADEAALKWAVCARALAWLEETRGKRQGGGTAAGRWGFQRTPGSYYSELYRATIQARKRAGGIVSGKVAADG